MGFKCLICHEDFGRDKLKWEKHCKEEHGGAAKILVDKLKKIAEEDK